MQLSKKDFFLLLERYLPLMNKGSHLSDDDYLSIGRLLNTISRHPQLRTEKIADDFMKAGNSHDWTLQMVTALGMAPGRGFAYTSTKYDFVLGGILDEKYQYKITDLNDQPRL